jgi:biopolymer transport protein ExbD
MVNLRRKQKKGASIPDAGMSDIVFLLLLFFLVSTTIDVDTGIGIVLPEYSEEAPVPIAKDRMVSILVNENGDVLLNKEIISIPQIKNTLIPKIQSRLDEPLKRKIVVSIKTDRKTNYNRYIQTLDQVRLAYTEVKEEVSHNLFGRGFKDLSETEQKEVRAKVNESISVAEPEKIK